MSSERIQKILAKAGIASRRKAEDLIRDGQVKVNGQVAKLGDHAEWGSDSIKVGGQLISKQEPPVFLAFFKPKSVISAMVDPEKRPTLSSYLQKLKQRVFPVGRLDFSSEGLILLTNDGGLAEKLQKHEGIPKVYQVKVKGHSNTEMLSRIERGGWFGSGENKRKIKPLNVRVMEYLNQKSLIQVVLSGAGAYDLRALFESRGFLVDRITRTAIGHLTLRGLKPGHYRFLKLSQLQALLNQPELAALALQKLNKAPQIPRRLPKTDYSLLPQPPTTIRSEALVASPKKKIIPAVAGTGTHKATVERKRTPLLTKKAASKKRGPLAVKKPKTRVQVKKPLKQASRKKTPTTRPKIRRASR